MNEEDSEQLGLYLEGIGFERASAMLEAQVILLNTCSVRKKPEDKAFSMLGELEPLRKAKPDLIIGVCGCMAQARADEIKRRAPHVDFVLGTGDIGQLPGLVEEAAQRRKFQKRVDLPERKGNIVESVPQRHLGRSPKLKAFVPIQYGCDKFCTFCIVPTTRGRERSRPTEDVVEEVSMLAAGGTKEITLLGQTVNSYGKNLVEGRVPFSQLLWKLSEIEGLERLRYMSPYPRDFRTDLIETIRDCPKVMEQCHMPIQSGDDSMLKEMHRLYTVDSYRKIIDELRSRMPGIGLTTDIIVGFPGETEDEFEQTLAVAAEAHYDSAYTFIFSPRPGTRAAEMEESFIDPDVIADRFERLKTVVERSALAKHVERVGRIEEALVEGPSRRDERITSARTRQGKLVHFAGEPSGVLDPGTVVSVEVTRGAPHHLEGKLIDVVKPARIVRRLSLRPS